MRAANLHPEFGYFCPTPGLRRMVKVALPFTVIGALVGAGGMAALIADHDSNIDGVAMTAHVETHSSDQPGASAPAMVKAETRPAVAAPTDTSKSAAKTERIKLDTGKSDVAKLEAARSATGPVRAKVEATKVDIAAMEAIKAGAPTADTSKSDAAKVNAAATACEGNACCEGNTWPSLDGTCGSSQVRKMRIVRVPTANRASPAAASASAPVAAVASTTAGTPKSSSPASSQSKPTQGVAEPAQQAVAAAKKPQKVAGQTRRRDQATSHVQPLRHEAVSPLASGPFGGFFGTFR
jgi:hypothetical protein